MTNLEQTLQYELDRRNTLIDALLSTMFTEVGGEICFVGGEGVETPLTSDETDLILEAYEMVDGVVGDED